MMSSSLLTRDPVLVLGAGPAGVTAGYLLGRAGADAIVLEAEDQVGGLAKTVVRDGYRFDLGGHRFFTKSAEVERLWHDVMGEELLVRPRQSRIHWNGRFLDYPLRAGNVVRRLGPLEVARCALSYAAAALKPAGEERTFEQWVTKRFGRRLFDLFFRSYTEKVWGVPTSEIRAEWAAQRIRGLSFGSAVRAALLGNRGNRIKSLIEEFHYPRLGPGQMWEAFAAELDDLRLETPVEGIEIEDGRVVAVEAGGERIPATAAISSLPLRTIVELAGDDAPAHVHEAAAGLRYRDFLTVAVALDREAPFPDTWIYVHDPDVRVARIQSYGAWSPAMLPDPRRACLGLEYFCFAGDDLWQTPDEELVRLATRELEALDLVPAGAVERGWVVRVPQAYPIYDEDYQERVDTIRAWLETVRNLQQVGRNGLHRYNNSDHSMLTAIRAVENLLHGTAHNLWRVNADGAYLEEGEIEEQPYLRVPEAAARR